MYTGGKVNKRFLPIQFGIAFLWVISAQVGVTQYS